MSTHEEYGSLRDRLVAVETKLDLVLSRLGDGHADHEVRLRALEARPDLSAKVAENAGRVRALEQFRWFATGAAATGGGALGAVVAQLLGGA